MLKHLSLSSCTFTSSSIQCHPCPPTRSGGFSPEHGILLCQDRFFSKRHMEDTLTHELVHAFDHCKFDVKWDDLRHHACSEVSGVWFVNQARHLMDAQPVNLLTHVSQIRAANLSGDCRWTREIKRGFHAFSKQHQVSALFLGSLFNSATDLSRVRVFSFQACVKRRAILSVRSNPSCAHDPSLAERAVNEVWESCWKDTRPFDEIY